MIEIFPFLFYLVLTTLSGNKESTKIMFLYNTTLLYSHTPSLFKVLLLYMYVLVGSNYGALSLFPSFIFFGFFFHSISFFICTYYVSTSQTSGFPLSNQLSCDSFIRTTWENGWTFYTMVSFLKKVVKMFSLIQYFLRKMS